MVSSFLFSYANLIRHTHSLTYPPQMLASLCLFHILRCRSLCGSCFTIRLLVTLAYKGYYNNQDLMSAWYASHSYHFFASRIKFSYADCSFLFLELRFWFSPKCWLIVALIMNIRTDEMKDVVRLFHSSLCITISWSLLFSVADEPWKKNGINGGRRRKNGCFLVANFFTQNHLSFLFDNLGSHRTSLLWKLAHPYPFSSLRFFGALKFVYGVTLDEFLLFTLKSLL
jgi:hypothetical protein